MTEMVHKYFKRALKLIDPKKKYVFEDEDIKSFVKTLTDNIDDGQKNHFNSFVDMFSNDKIKFSFKSLTKGKKYVDLRFYVKCDVCFVNIFQIKWQTYYESQRLDISFNNNTKKLIDNAFHFKIVEAEKIFKIIVKFLCNDIV